jgi:sodium-dependent dicarboxylate transporter 2/3/5
LGTLGHGEKRVALVFLTVALAWIVQPLLARWLPWLSDTAIALLGALVLFTLRADPRGREPVLDWNRAQQLPWGVLILFGGGLSLASAINASGLAAWLAAALGGFGALPTVLMIAAVVTVIIFLTELTSNTATAAAFLPLVGALALAQGLSPALFAVPAAIAASCAFMLPVATPPNAIVFGSGRVSIRSMIRAGFVLNLFGIAVVTLTAYGLGERLP